MKLRSLFEVIFKILGVYLIIKAITFAPQLISILGFYYGSKPDLIAMLGNIGVVILVVLFFILIGMYIIRRSNKLTRLIVPEDRLEEDFTTFKIHRSIVLTISVIVIGGIILVQEFPRLSVQLAEMIKHNRVDNPLSDFNNTVLIVSIVKILIALYLVFYCKTVVAWIELKRK